jgi:hypothetical protein
MAEPVDNNRLGDCYVTARRASDSFKVGNFYAVPCRIFPTSSYCVIGNLLNFDHFRLAQGLLSSIHGSGKR